MHTIKRVGLHDTRKFEDIKYMVSSKGCMGCVDTNTDIMFAIDSTEIGQSETVITQIFMSNEETLELILKLQNAIERNFNER